MKPVYNFVARGGAQAQCDFGCAPLRSSGSGLVIRDHSDHSRSNEPMNPIWTRIHSEAQMIYHGPSDLGLSQTNVPFDFFLLV